MRQNTKKKMVAWFMVLTMFLVVFVAAASFFVK